MISDEQGREWLLRKLYDDGWRYYVKASNGCMYLTKEKPDFCEDGKSINPYSGGTTKCTDSFVGLIPEMQLNEVLDIAKCLDIVNWFEVKVNTPILVRDSTWDAWKIGHFARCRKGHIFVWEKGKTSYTTKRTEMFRYAKLVGDNDERNGYY